MIWCNRDLVRNPYHVGLCLSPKKFKKELKRIGADEDLVFIKSPQSDATTWIIKDGEGKEVIIVCVKNSKKRRILEVIGLLVHEAVHIWQTIKSNIGESSPSIEFEAYSIQAIAQELITAYYQLTKRTDT